VFMFTPYPAHAQPSNSLNARVAALEAAVAALQAGQTTLQAADTTLQNHINAEAGARAAADATLQTNIDGEATARVAATTALQNSDAALDTRVFKLEGNITSADLAGTYSWYAVQTEVHAAPFNDLNRIQASVASYIGFGTLTVNADGSGSINVSENGYSLASGTAGTVAGLGPVQKAGWMTVPFTPAQGNPQTGVFPPWIFLVRERYRHGTVHAAGDPLYSHRWRSRVGQQQHVGDQQLDFSDWYYSGKRPHHVPDGGATIEQS
jgi:hypothetical protein